LADTNWILKYYQDINDGSITVGKWVQILYQKIIDDLNAKKYCYDNKKANKAIKFFELACHHSKGSLAPKRVKLEEWQKAIIACIFGLVDEDGTRHFREVFCLMGRKCGKSLLASGIAEYMVYADGEYGADVYFLAPRLEQTDIVFNDFWQSVSHEPTLKAITKPRKTDVYVSKTNTSVKKIAFSQKKSDGFNPHLTICDEIAAWQGDAGIKQYEVMSSALGSRKQPLIVSITTANYVNDGIYDDLFKRSTRFLMGESNENRILPFLYMIDDTTKWNDLNELQKSLPNLNVSVSADFMLEEIAKAEQSLASKAEFLTKYCNIKQNSSQAWLDAVAVDKCFGDALTLDDFRDTYCVGGIDLSQTTDLTSCCVVIEKNSKLYVFSKFFLPSQKIEEATAKDGVPYQMYVERGLLQLSGENFVDYNDCYNWFKELVEEYKIYPLQVGYDRYSAQYLVQDMTAYGFHMDDVFQGTNLTPVIREFEGIIKDQGFDFGDNDLLKMHLLDSALKQEQINNKCRLVKLNNYRHIDGTAALLDAMCVRQKWYGEIGEQLRNEA